MFSVNFNADLGMLRPLAPSKLVYFEKQADRISLTALSYFCHAIHKAPGSEFYVSGFGDSHWAGEVRVELCIFLEQMPAVMPWLKRRKPSSEIVLSLFEQGYERDFLHFFDGKQLSVRCVPGLMGWAPDPEVETIDADICENQYRSVIAAFCACAKIIDPKAYRDLTFQKWKYDSLHY